jgi:hypothetical protein
MLSHPGRDRTIQYVESGWYNTVYCGIGYMVEGYAPSREVAGSNLNEVTDFFFNFHNPSSHSASNRNFYGRG